MSIEEAIKELDRMIVEYQYHIYDDAGRVIPKYSELLLPCTALQMAVKALEENRKETTNA